MRGVIDRDFRLQHEILALELDGVYCLKVAEVENLFVVPELLKIMQEQLACEESSYDNAVKFIMDLFEGCKARQIKEAFVKEVDYQLSMLHFDESNLSVNEVKRIIDSKFTEDNISLILNEKKELYDNVTDIEDILKVFNFKELIIKMGSKFGIVDRDYPKRVINILKNGNDEIKTRIVESLKKYLPDVT